MSVTTLNPFQLQFESLLRRAVDLGASDIHFEPFENETRVRARVDGNLLELAHIQENKFRNRLFEQAKKTCGFDMGKSGETQDARFSNIELRSDFRASLMPVLAGEKIVLRIIPRDKGFSLDNYGLPPDALSKLKTVLSSWQGLIVTSGPTGSGKTSLMYSMLSNIDASKNNIATIEDPIEYTIPGINQTQIDRAKGVDFAQAIRASLRQDPDVILIGEVRDKETAEAALHAAQTGHVVLTTVHANSAVEVMSRLVGLGLERQALMENLLFVSAQRLVPKLCPCCSTMDIKAKAELVARGINDIEPNISVGCEACNGRGEKGRALLFEYTHNTEEQKRTNVISTYYSLQGTARRLLKDGVIGYENANSFL